MNQRSTSFTAFRVLLIGEIIVFLTAATFHTGAFGIPPIADAALVESLCAAACVVCAYAIFTGRGWALMAAVAAQVFCLAGVLLGLAALIHFSYLLTPINISFHGIMLVLIIPELSLLSKSDTRKAFPRRSEHPLS